MTFHKQQTIEKSFKAVLEEREKEIPKVHDLFNFYNHVKVESDLELGGEKIRELNEL